MQKHDTDCLQACLSYIFNIKYEDIPEFYKYFDKEDDSEFSVIFDNWLASIGYIRVMVPAKCENGKGVSIVGYYNNRKKYIAIGILQKKFRKYSHAVVLISQDGYMEMQDPKKNSDYDLTDLEYIEIFIKGEIKNGKIK